MLCILNGLCNLFNLGDQNSSFVPRSCQILRFGAGYAIIPKKGWSFRARRVRESCWGGGGSEVTLHFGKMTTCLFLNVLNLLLMCARVLITYNKLCAVRIRMRNAIQ